MSSWISSIDVSASTTDIMLFSLASDATLGVKVLILVEICSATASLFCRVYISSVVLRAADENCITKSPKLVPAVNASLQNLMPSSSPSLPSRFMYRFSTKVVLFLLKSVLLRVAAIKFTKLATLGAATLAHATASPSAGRPITAR